MQSPAPRKEKPQAGDWQAKSSSVERSWGCGPGHPPAAHLGCRGDHNILGCVNESMTRSGEGITCLYSATLGPLVDTPVTPAAPHSPQCRRNIRNLEWVQCWGTTAIRAEAFALWREAQGSFRLEKRWFWWWLSWSQILHSGEWWENERQ